MKKVLCFLAAMSKVAKGRYVTLPEVAGLPHCQQFARSGEGWEGRASSLLLLAK
jgi:hypothetical protein